MAQPMDKPLFDALMTRAEIPLTEVEREGIRLASGHIMAAIDSVRRPRAVAVEPTTIFLPKASAP